MEKRTFRNGQKLDREQVLLAILTRYEDLNVYVGRAGLEGVLVTPLLPILDTGSFGGKCHHPSGARGRGRKEHNHESEGEKGGGKDDDKRQVLFVSANEKCKRCGEAGHRTMKCLDQVCDVCGRKELTGVGTSRSPNTKTMTTL